MTIMPLEWSDPDTVRWATIEAQDGDSQWKITHVAGDVYEILFVGRDADGTLVVNTEPTAYADSLDEARIVVDVLRAGTDHLPDWRKQLKSAGFTPSHFTLDERTAGLWNDQRRTGHFHVQIRHTTVRGCGRAESWVLATYRMDKPESRRTVSSVDGWRSRARMVGTQRSRGGLPEGVDALKAGVAAAIAIRDARAERGGSFAVPLGGPTRKRAKG